MNVTTFGAAQPLSDPSDLRIDHTVAGRSNTRTKTQGAY